MGYYIKILLDIWENNEDVTKVNKIGYKKKKPTN